MKILLILTTLLFSLTSQSQVLKLTKNEFLKKIDQGKIQFQIIPVAREIGIATLMKISELTTPPELSETDIRKIEQAIIKDNAMKYSYFQAEMFNVRYMQDGPWRYSITFDFATTRQCTLRVEKVDFTCGNPCCSTTVTDPRLCTNADINGEKIPDSYCEKIYGIKIKQ